jgi:hypothetical protein
MAITQAVCNSAKVEFIDGVHLAANTYKLALYTSAAVLSKATTAYTVTAEVAASGTYGAGGFTLSGRTSGLTGDNELLTFTSPAATGATITARGALIYNSSVSNKALFVLDFGADITSTAGTFTVNIPANLLTLS